MLYALISNSYYFLVALTKKDLTRFLAHQEQRIQRAATSYILAIVQRVERLLKSVGGKRSNSLEIILLPIFSKYLPEFQNLLSTRTRYKDFL